MVVVVVVPNIIVFVLNETNLEMKTGLRAKSHRSALSGFSVITIIRLRLHPELFECVYFFENHSVH